MNWLWIMVLFVSLHRPSANVHDIHISKLEMNYAQQEQSYQLAVKIFIDDLESALSEDRDQQIFLFQHNELANADSLISDYLNHTINLETDNSPVYWRLIGKEPSEDLSAAWCYLEIENVPSHQTINLEVKLLFELFDNQKNIVSLDGFQDERLHFIFDQSDYSKSLVRE